MKENATRRRLLQATAIVGMTAATVVGVNGYVLADDSTDGPELGSVQELVRVWDNGYDEGRTNITVRNQDDTIVFSTSVITKGSNHPDLEGLTLEEKQPKMAADIDSFGGIPRGHYRVEAEHDGETESVRVQVVGEGDLVDGNVISIRLEPGGGMDILVSHGDPAH